MSGSAYKEFLQYLLDFFARQPGLGNGEFGLGETLTDILTAPIEASPDSLEGQLRFIIEKWDITWRIFLTSHLARIGLSARRDDPQGTRPESIRKRPKPMCQLLTEVNTRSMSAIVRIKTGCLVWSCLAKNTYVWLGQLSKKYQREITTLDQIPDEELDLVASRGFTGLWLIGFVAAKLRLAAHQTTHGAGRCRCLGILSSFL